MVVETGLEWFEEICTTFISTKSNTQFSEPSAALAQQSCSAPAPALFPTTPSPLIFMATRGATRADNDDDDDDDNVAVADDDDSALLFSETNAPSVS